METRPSDTETGSLAVLIINSDLASGKNLADTLARSNIPAIFVRTATEGMPLIELMRINVVIVYDNITDTNLYSIIPVLLKYRFCGIIIASDQDEGADCVVSLELGADDYISKTVTTRELLARIHAVYRRAIYRSPIVVGRRAESIVWLGETKLDLEKRHLTSSDGQMIRLTSAEVAALDLLIFANGTVVSRDIIVQTTHRRQRSLEDRSVDQLMFSIRHKMSLCGPGVYIFSVRRLGYALRFTRECLPVGA